MIKLLIADDEPLVCVGLRSMLKWSDLGIEISGSARNGQEAAHMIAQIKPDIVIADIKMPVMTGLELAEECAKRYGQPPLFIILTSFEEFGYARRAIQAHVVDYLVKLELSPDILQTSIESALGTLSELKQHKTAGAEHCGMRIQQERFFLRLYNSLFETEQQFCELKNDAAIDFAPGPYAAAICSIAGPAVDEAIKTAKLYESTMQMVQETLSDSFCCYVTPLEQHKFCIAICMEWDTNPDEQPLLRDTLENITDMVRKYLQVHLLIAVGCLVNDPGSLAESYVDAKRLSAGLTVSQPLIISDKRQIYRHQLIINVQKFIQENLRTHLSLYEVATEFNISPSYLSQLFAKAVGKSFVEYVTETRVAAAKEMLTSGELKIYEVSDILGFGNAFYFSKVFKKIEGISPREYLKKLFGDNAPPEGDME